MIFVDVGIRFVMFLEEETLDGKIVYLIYYF
jgi:hypothetical protein